MELIKENDILSLKLTNKEAIQAELFDENDFMMYNVHQIYCSVCSIPFALDDFIYYCADNDEVLCEDCYADYIDYNNPERALGTQVRKLNSFLTKHRFNKKVNGITFELEDV